MSHRYALGAIALAGVLTLGVGQASSDPPARLAALPAPGATRALLAQEVGGNGASPSDVHLHYLQKLDSHLQDIAASGLGSGSAVAVSAAAERQGIVLSPSGGVAVDVYVDGDIATATDRLRALGMRVTATSDRAPERMVEGVLPPDALVAASALATTHAIISTSPATTATGSVTSLGDAATHGPAARALGPTGSGVTVGVISDSMNQVGGGIAASQATGDLPRSVNDLGELAGGEDEGRAMSEILYDEAPGIAGIDFETGALGVAAKAGAIDNLVAHGVRVIADDTTYVDEPFFQDDIVSQAVDRAKAAGVAYLAAAGNYYGGGWGGTYSGVSDQSGRSSTTEDFDPGPGVDTIQTVGELVPGRESTITLEWAEPWGHATDDFAIDVYTVNGSAATYAFTVDTNNIATGIPMEYVTFAPVQSTLDYGIAIRHVSGSGTPFLKYLATPDGTDFPEHPAFLDSIGPDAAAARGALAIAASDYSTPAKSEEFSSVGPVTRFFDSNGAPLATPDVRQKPDLAGPDDVNTSVPGFAPFFGTSAATPADAGITALIWSAKPAMPVDELYAIMTDPVNALDCPAPGSPDYECGAGFLLADRAVSMALDATPPTIAPALVPATPNGANGWFTTGPSVSWAVADPGSPVVDASGCAPATPADGVTTLTCSAISAGGTTSVPLTVKLDSTPPTVPVISGLGAETYTTATLPAQTAIACAATDPTSGVDSCTVSGYAPGVGSHTLTAVATNDAGLTATATLVYRVVKPAAIAHLGVSKVGLAALARAGLSVRIAVNARSTHLTLALVALVPKGLGKKGTRTVSLGSLKKTVGAGTVRLRVRVTPKARKFLRGLGPTRLRLTISGASASSKGAKLQVSFVARQ